MDKTPIIIIVLIVLAGVIFWAFQSGIFTGPIKPTQLPAGPVLFFGEDCPHCKIVEAYITDNGIDQKVKYTKMEIPFNGKTSPELKANAELLVQLAQTCELDMTNGVSIPFLYDGSKCLVGQDDVINFFKNAAGTQ